MEQGSNWSYRSLIICLSQTSEAYPTVLEPFPCMLDLSYQSHWLPVLIEGDSRNTRLACSLA